MLRALRLRRPLTHDQASRALRLGSAGVCGIGTDSRGSRPKGKHGLLAEAGNRSRLYAQLSKYRLSALVMSTTSAGYLAAGGPVDALTLSWACLGTMLASSSANTFNQVIETENDSRMKRTRARPLPSGRITREHALGWGVASGV